MADTKISALAAITQLDGTEQIPVAHGGTNKKYTPTEMREYLSVPWAGRVPSNTNTGLVSPVLGDVQTAVESSILGAVDAFHYVPFILTPEQADAGYTKMRLKFQGNTGLSTDAVYIAVYSALDDTILGEVERAASPNGNAWVEFNLPSVATWPRQVYIGISSGISGGAGASCEVAAAIIQSFPGYPGSIEIGAAVGVSAVPTFIVSSAWDTAPALSGIGTDLASLTTMPFLMLL